MSPAELPAWLIRDIAPPSQTSLDVKDLVLFALQLLWGFPLVLFDYAVLAYSKIFPPPEKSLKGKVVLVTGAGRGLGRGLALRFAEEGSKVAVVDIIETNAAKTAADIVSSGGVAKAYLCNVADCDAIRALRQSVTADLGPVDILVNNAGILYFGDLLEDCEERDIRSVVEVNLLSHFWMLKEFLPEMKARNSGHIVAIASAASFTTGEKGGTYAACKYGVRGLMETLYCELDLSPDNNVFVTSVYPYFINTSADYMSRWITRFPAVTIEEAAELTVAGVKKNSVSVFIPGFIWIFVNFIMFLPWRSFMRVKKIVVPDILPLNKENMKYN